MLTVLGDWKDKTLCFDFFLFFGNRKLTIASIDDHDEQPRMIQAGFSCSGASVKDIRMCLFSQLHVSLGKTHHQVDTMSNPTYRMFEDDEIMTISSTGMMTPTVSLYSRMPSDLDH